MESVDLSDTESMDEDPSPEELDELVELLIPRVLNRLKSNTETQHLIGK